MQNVYNTDDRDGLILQLAEILKDLTNWGRFDSPEEWQKKIIAFDLVVKSIPTEHLEHCVMYAAQNHKKNRDFAPVQVAEAWTEIAEVISRDRQGGHLARQQTLQCPHCRGTGFVYLQNIKGLNRVVSPCKNKCKSVTDLSQKAEPMPIEVKELLKTLEVASNKKQRPESMPQNFSF